MFERSRTSKPRLAALASLAGGLAGGVATVVRRRRASAGVAEDDGPATWSCECGQEYRVSGQDRHRVYWLKDADASDPVIGGRCPNCDRPLPGEHVTAEAKEGDDADDADGKDAKGDDAKGEADRQETA